MEIQDEVPLLPNPLADLESDYRDAVLHVAWDRHAKTNKRTLLFAFVELLPTEIPPPIDDYHPKSQQCCYRLASGSLHSVCVRHAVMTAGQALSWYQACREGVAVLPENDGTILPSGRETTKQLTLAALGEEPIWPTLTAASDDTDAIPFVPQWIEHPRTHHLLPVVEFERGALWTKNEADAARRWLAGQLHFDLAEYPEYWGSVHLIAPNPVYRSMGMRLQPQGTNESVLLRFQPRTGKSVEGLEITFVEKDAWGVTAAKHARVRSPLIRMNFDRDVNAVVTDVWDTRRGFLQVNNQHHVFVKSIETNFGLIEKTIVESKTDSYEVMRSGKPETSVVGTPHRARASRLRMVAAHHDRQRRLLAAARDQRWFREQREDARDLLRSLLHEANSQVLVIDPYFGATELVGFAPAVGRYDIPIRILSSAEVLRKPTAKGGDLENGDELLDALAQLEKHERMNPFEIRVMRGQRAAVHDRFLLIDKRIWLLGSSLNEFGSRGTMIVALPDPEAVRGDLTKAWDDAEPLKHWTVERRQRRKHSEGEDA